MLRLNFDRLEEREKEIIEHLQSDMRSRLNVVLESILRRTTMVVRLPTTPKRLTTSSATPSIQNCTPPMKLLYSSRPSWHWYDEVVATALPLAPALVLLLLASSTSLAEVESEGRRFGCTFGSRCLLYLHSDWQI